MTAFTRQIRRRRYLGVALAVVSLLVAGCGSDDDSADGTTTTTEASADDTTTTTEAPDTDSGDEGGSEGESQLTFAEREEIAWEALLTAQDLGDELEDQVWEPESDDAPPCDQPDPDDDYPPSVQVGNVVQGTTEMAAMQQEIRIYADEDEASTVLGLVDAYFGCVDGQLGGSPANLSEHADISDLDPTIDAGFGLDFETPDFQGSILIARTGDTIVVFQFASGPDADLSIFPPVEEVVTRGMQKLADA